jgi:hypothetical protein
MGLFAGASLINLTPVFLRPLVGRLVCFNVSRLATKCLKRCYPTVEERLQSDKRRKEDPSNDWIPPVSTLPVAENLTNNINDRRMACNG